MSNELVPKADITSETVARLLNEAGIQVTGAAPHVVMVAGVGTMGITGLGGQPNLAFNCVLRFQKDLDLEARQVIANQLMRRVPGFRSYVNEKGEVVCKSDLMVAGGLLPSQLTYTCNMFRLMMRNVVSISDGVLA